MTDVSLLVAVLVTVLFSPICTNAGPPVLTDDTGTPGPGKWEINVGFTTDKRHDETRYDIPALDMNYGVGEHIQLNYSVSWIILDTRNEGTKNGLSNSEIAMKWRFADEERNGVALSVYPRLIFNNPTSSADRGLVDKGITFRLPVQLEKKIGMIILNTEVGHDFHQRGGDEWLYGFVLKYVETKGLEALAEIFGTSNRSFKRHGTVFNIGARYEIGKHYTLLASAGRSFHSAPDQPSFLSYLGIQFRF